MSPRKKPQAGSTPPRPENTQETLSAIESTLPQQIQNAPEGSEAKSRLQGLLSLLTSQKTPEASSPSSNGYSANRFSTLLIFLSFIHEFLKLTSSHYCH